MDSGARSFYIPSFWKIMGEGIFRKVFRSLERDLLHSPMLEKPCIWREPIPENSSGLWRETFYIPSCRKVFRSLECVGPCNSRLSGSLSLFAGIQYSSLGLYLRAQKPKRKTRETSLPLLRENCRKSPSREIRKPSEKFRWYRNIPSWSSKFVRLTDFEIFHPHRRNSSD